MDESSLTGESDHVKKSEMIDPMLLSGQLSRFGALIVAFVVVIVVADTLYTLHTPCIQIVKCTFTPGYLLAIGTLY